MCEKGLPWWHVANVPFQAVCVFLAMDVRESLSHIGTAMRTLEDVAERFQTVAGKEALKTARFLVRLSKKRKDEDSDVLDQVLKKGAVNGDPEPENLEPPTNFDSSILMSETPMTATSEDWSQEALRNFPEWDWSLLLTADMPAFSNFAPDGTM